MTGVASVTVNRARYASMTPGQKVCRTSAHLLGWHALDAHDARRSPNHGHRVQPIDGAGEGRVRGNVGDEDERRRVAPALLANSLDAHLLVRECLRHSGQYAGPVRNVQRNVVASHYLPDRLDTQRG